MSNKIFVNSYVVGDLYVKIYFLIVIFCSVPFILNYIFLKEQKEFLSVEEIYQLQNSTKEKVLYGSAIFNGFRELKLYSYASRKPKIVCFGSSRVLEFREAFFSTAFYNMGYMASSIDEAENSITCMLEKHIPEVIILGVDFWWFNEIFHKPSYNTKFQVLKNKFDPSHLILPFKWIAAGQISFKDYYMTIINKFQHHHIGVRANLNASGIARDGSNYYTDIVIGANKLEHRDVRFADTLNRVRNGTDRFCYAKQSSSHHFKRFMNLVNKIKSKGVNLILFIPPVAPSVWKEMRLYNYDYIADLKKKFLESSVDIYDFTDTQDVFCVGDSEFIDGFHGGDVLYARILKKITCKYNILKKYVDIDFIDKCIISYSGFAMIPDSGLMGSGIEIDFLQLGINKVAPIL